MGSLARGRGDAAEFAEGVEQHNELVVFLLSVFVTMRTIAYREAFAIGRQIKVAPEM
jgi:hypothetical protein